MSGQKGNVALGIAIVCVVAAIAWSIRLSRTMYESTELLQHQIIVLREIVDDHEISRLRDRAMLAAAIEVFASDIPTTVARRRAAIEWFRTQTGYIPEGAPNE